MVILRALGSLFGRAELARRAARIRLVVTDNDGVLTDGKVYYSARGEELKRFSLRDGMGVERLRDAGIATAIMTGEQSPQVERRAEKLGIRAWLGVKDKRAALLETGVEPAHIAFIGDDVNDLDAIRFLAPVGLTAAPRDAFPRVLESVHLRTAAIGGDGAFRELAEWILTRRRSS